MKKARLKYQNLKEEEPSGKKCWQKLKKLTRKYFFNKKKFLSKSDLEERVEKVWIYLQARIYLDRKLILFRTEGQKGPPYKFFPCNFYKRRIYPPKQFFCSNPYKIEVTTTSFIEMLQLPIFGHMTTSKK